MSQVYDPTIIDADVSLPKLTPERVKLGDGDARIIEDLLKRIRGDYEALGQLQHDYMIKRSAGLQSVNDGKRELTTLLQSIQRRYLPGTTADYAYDGGELVLQRKP